MTCKHCYIDRTRASAENELNPLLLYTEITWTGRLKAKRSALILFHVFDCHSSATLEAVARELCSSHRIECDLKHVQLPTLPLLSFLDIKFRLFFWMNKKSQLVWLSYQLFTVLSMHVARLSGLVDCGRTELRVARLFELGEGVLLKGAKGQQVYATATTNWVENVADARNAVKRVTRS